MTKESIYELQLIDCNCNDCWYMVRDLEKFKGWSEFHKELQYEDFWRQKIAAEKHARELDSTTLINKALKMKFQFQQSGSRIQYGHCHKFNKPVSFIPNTCQLETQGCFEHRRKKNNEI